MIPTSAVELKNITKRFGAFTANEDVCLDVKKGTIHAILGENGAGKSTLMKVLYGQLRPDGGEVLVEGVARAWRSPRDAIKAGIGMVHQHFMLSSPQSVVENVLLGESAPVLGRLHVREGIEKLNALCDQVGFDRLPWNSPVGELPVGLQQRVEILKLLYQDARVLILDEPTAVLIPAEVDDLFLKLRRLVEKEGKTILLITHKLREIMDFSDEVTVLRQGKRIETFQTAQTSASALAESMVGRKLNDWKGRLNFVAPKVLLRAKGVCTDADSLLGRVALDQINFEVGEGEVVGIAGVEGNGQRELISALAHPDFDPYLRAGSFEFGDKRWDIAGVKRNREDRKAWDDFNLNLGYIPEDRHREGLLLESTLLENFILRRQRDPTIWKSASSRLKRGFEALDIRPAREDAKAQELSGGNQQKLIVARELDRNPKLLLAVHPTRGVDAGAIEHIHQWIFEAVTGPQKMGVLLFSTELEELLKLSDRIYVLFGGRFLKSVRPSETSERELGSLMGGLETGGAS